MNVLGKVGVLAVALIVVVTGALYTVDTASINKVPSSFLGSAGAYLSNIGAQYYSGSDSYDSYESDDGPSGLSFVFAAVLGLIPASIAQKKGRSFGLWWFYGFMIFIVALIHSLVMSSKNTANVEPQEVD